MPCSHGSAMGEENGQMGAYPTSHGPTAGTRRLHPARGTRTTMPTVHPLPPTHFATRTLFLQLPGNARNGAACARRGHQHVQLSWRGHVGCLSLAVTSHLQPSNAPSLPPRARPPGLSTGVTGVAPAEMGPGRPKVPQGHRGKKGGHNSCMWEIWEGPAYRGLRHPLPGSTGSPQTLCRHWARMQSLCPPDQSFLTIKPGK